MFLLCSLFVVLLLVCFCGVVVRRTRLIVVVLWVRVLLVAVFCFWLLTWFVWVFVFVFGWVMRVDDVLFVIFGLGCFGLGCVMNGVCVWVDIIGCHALYLSADWFTEKFCFTPCFNLV